MSWKKHFTVYNNTNQKSSRKSKGSVEGYNTRFQSWLPEVYSGMPNRIERYMQYDQMDMDVEINMALDTIAEFSTQIDDETELPFTIKYKKEPTDTETKVLNNALTQWCNINEWDRRIFKTFRNVIKYGDQPFIRDPETWELMYVNPQDVTGVVINESEGKNPAQYILRNLDLNLQDKTATTPIAVNRNAGSTTQSPFSSARTGASTSYNTNVTSLNTTQEEFNVDSSNVIHVALSEGMDANYPFGSSILDSVFKTYKQKELLEDSLIIYRVQRAPERRVFYIDTGDMPPHRATAFLEQMKMEVHQKRIPNKTGGGSSIMDAQYNPMCLTLDTKIPLLDGRTLELNELISEYQNGKENWAYSCDPETGKIVPGVITWAGVTRKNAEVVKLTFDNGKTLTVTPDHKIPVFGKGFVEAQNLTPEDSLISFETRGEKLPSSNNDTTYTQVFDHEEKEWKFVHRLVAGYFRKLNQHQEFTYILEGNKNVVHHKDFNRYNNDPRNLQWMNAEDHFKFHGDTNFWNSVTPEEADRVKNKIRKTLQDRWNNLSNDQREKELNKILDTQMKAVWLRQNDPVYKENYRKNIGESRLKFLEKNSNFVKDGWYKGTKTYQENYLNQNKNYSFRMIQIIAETVKKYNSNKKETIHLLSNNQEFLNEIEINNPSDDPKKNCKIIYDKVTNTTLDKTLWHFGYKGWKDFKEKLNVFNHRLVKIEYLNNSQDTGTITIDGNERWHDYHTFATDSGIFVKNSILEDYFFSQTCLSLGTNIPLLDGRELPLSEIIDEYHQGKENWVYGLSDKTHELEAAKITWAGITRKNAKVLKVVLDNGESVIATPDHRFITRDGKEVEAKDLDIGDSLMPLTLMKGYSGPNQNNKKYMRYVSNNDGKRKFVHSTIANKPIGKDTQVHHKDFDSFNNNPSNLQIMKTEDHIQLHKEIGTYSLTTMWKDPEGRKKLIAGMRKMYDNADEEFMKKISERNRKNTISYWNNLDEDIKNKKIEAIKDLQKYVSDKKRINYDINMFNAMVECFDNGYTSVKTLSKELRTYQKFIDAYNNANPYIIRDKQHKEKLCVTDTTLNKIVNVVGYRTFGNWKEEYTNIPKFSNKKISRQNHKIVDIIELEDTIDTGDITIESDSDSHWFGLSSGIYVHNSEGRGSKVEVLPGGQSLGEIEDLLFFSDKLMRGLRVPNSYMPQQSSNDSGMNFTDGRVGTAFIQEFRFNKYCLRLQNTIQPVFDREFKRFMKNRGFNIDSSMFELQFPEPQSFSDYRQIELDSAKAGVFAQLEGVDYLSRRFILKKYLGLSDSEILENERLYQEENPEISGSAAEPGMEDIGLRGGDDFDEDIDLDDFDDDGIGDEEGLDSPISGAEGAEDPPEQGQT